jgi:hypothetical protein
MMASSATAYTPRQGYNLPHATVRTTQSLTHEEALRCYIESYFADDVKFNENVEKNLKYVIKRSLKPTSYDLSHITLRQAIKLASQVENASKRVPMILNASRLATIEPCKLVQDLKIDPNTRIESFRGAITTPMEMIDSVEERRKNKKRYPITVVADLPFTSKQQYDLADRIKQHIKWNALIFNTDFEQTSLVLSDTDALATPHIHPNMFWNCSFCGTKVYLLVDTDEFAAKIENNTFTRKKLPWTEKTTYRSTYEFEGKITFTEFCLMKNAYFAVISSDGPNFILVPTRYMHEVWTVCGGKDGVYAGLVGGAMPRNPSFRQATEDIKKDKSIQSFFGVKSIEHWFDVEDDELDKIMVDLPQSEYDVVRLKKAKNNSKSNKTVKSESKSKPEIKIEPRTVKRKKKKEDYFIEDEDIDYTEENEDPNKLYCICRKPWDPKLFMIACDVCSDWFHGKCIYMTEKQSKKIFQYVCPGCEKKTNQQTITKRELKKKKLVF